MNVDASVVGRDGYREEINEKKNEKSMYGLFAGEVLVYMPVQGD